MAITRTAMIDDDGSGTTGTIINNAWKTELYNQIDAMPATSSGIVSWVPTDASGAGLVLTVSSAYYVKAGRLVTITLNGSYPATANGNPAVIGGLPFATVGASGLYTGYGPVRVFHVPNGSTQILIFNATSGAQYTNAQLSGAAIAIAGIYHTSA